MANYINGCKFTNVNARSIGLKKAGKKEKVLIVTEESSSNIMSVVGHGNKSMTFIPTIQATPIHGLTIVDAPGFLDNRGTSINIANTINLNAVFQKAKSVRILVLIN